MYIVSFLETAFGNNIERETVQRVGLDCQAEVGLEKVPVSHRWGLFAFSGAAFGRS